MTLGPRVSKVLSGIGVLLLLGLAWTGVSGAIEQWPGVHTAGQRVQTIAQLVFGIFSLLSIVVRFRARRWSRVAFVGFVASLAIAAGLAPVAWGHQGVGIGLLSGAASLLIGAVIIWLLREGAPHANPTDPI